MTKPKSTWDLLTSGDMKPSDVVEEVRAHQRLQDPNFHKKHSLKILDAVDQALATPDIEVKITFDTSTEFGDGSKLIGELAAMYPNFKKLIDWDKSTGNTLELKNGSALTFLTKTDNPWAVKIK